MSHTESRRQRILHVITGLGFGGAEATLRAVVCGLDKARFEQHVVSLTDAGYYGSALRQHGIEVTCLGMTRGLPSWRAWCEFRRTLRRFAPDVLQTWLYHADFLGLVSTLVGERARLIWNLRCAEMEFAHYSPLTRWLVGCMARLSDRPWGVIVNSAAGRRHHSTLGYHPRRWAVIPNGFDTTRFHPDPVARLRVRAALRIPLNTPLIGMVARVDPMKDHATLLDALAELAMRGTAPHCVLIGADTETLAPAARVRGLGDIVHPLGARADVEAWLPGLDVHVLSSLGEGLPNVVGEAMACAVPCIVSDVGDAAVLVGATGRVVPPRDPPALAAAIADLCVAADRVELGVRARQRVAEQYAWAPTIRRYADIYAEASAATN